jgi:hypothetical protein
MRWVDVMSEVAFTVMDLEDRRRADLAHRFLNAYLERTGDYAGLAVLRFYLVYRALVRAKIARLRAAQLEAGAASRALHAEYRGYVNLARRYARPPRPGLVITHGLSGCGKTTLSQALLETIGAVRIRSDVERKRMHDVRVVEKAGTGIESGLYTRMATGATYERLRTRARAVLMAGRIALVDATFLQRWQRDLFCTLAAELGIPFVIFAFAAKEATLRERVARRHLEGRDASDADLAVLAHQIAAREPLAEDELPFVVNCDAEALLAAARAPEAWSAVRARLEGEAAGP